MHADGGGLYLYVKPGGGKSWIFRYQISGRRREMGLGAVANIPITAARSEAARLRSLVAQKVDPLEEKHRALVAEGLERAAENRETALLSKTFTAVAENYIAAQEAGWRNVKHRQQWENTLKTYAYPVLGEMPVRDIGVQHVLGSGPIKMLA